MPPVRGLAGPHSIENEIFGERNWTSGMKISDYMLVYAKSAYFTKGL